MHTHEPPPGDDEPGIGGGEGGDPPPNNRTRRETLPTVIAGILERNAADAAFLDRIVSARIEIGNLRRQKMHLTADIQCDQLWCELEAWIDPQRGAGASVLDVER